MLFQDCVPHLGPQFQISDPKSQQFVVWALRDKPERMVWKDCDEWCTPKSETARLVRSKCSRQLVDLQYLTVFWRDNRLWSFWGIHWMIWHETAKHCSNYTTCHTISQGTQRNANHQDELQQGDGFHGEIGFVHGNRDHRSMQFSTVKTIQPIQQHVDLYDLLSVSESLLRTPVSTNLQNQWVSSLIIDEVIFFCDHLQVTWIDFNETLQGSSPYWHILTMLLKAGKSW